MTIIQQVRDVLEMNAGVAMTTDEIDSKLKGVDRSQINGALWRLRTEDPHIEQVRTGLHRYTGPRIGGALLDAQKARESMQQSTFEMVEPDDIFVRIGYTDDQEPLVKSENTGEVFKLTKP